MFELRRRFVQSHFGAICSKSLSALMMFISGVEFLPQMPGKHTGTLSKVQGRNQRYAIWTDTSLKGNVFAKLRVYGWILLPSELFWSETHSNHICMTGGVQAKSVLHALRERAATVRWLDHKPSKATGFLRQSHCACGRYLIFSDVPVDCPQMHTVCESCCLSWRGSEHLPRGSYWKAMRGVCGGI